jgi:UDP-N-acetyl-D-glucosamine dehydrogenase
MPFYPGPGIGGDCIPIGPLYLAWKVKELNYSARFIELAGAVNSSMPEYVVSRVADALDERGKGLLSSRLLVLGVAYKKDVDDTRESPALSVLDLLKKKGAKVSYADPYVPAVEVSGEALSSYDLRQGFSGFDCVIIVTNHSGFDYAALVQEASLVFDARNATAGVNVPATCRVVKL